MQDLFKAYYAQYSDALNKEVMPFWLKHFQQLLQCLP